MKMSSGASPVEAYDVTVPFRVFDADPLSSPRGRAKFYLHGGYGERLAGTSITAEHLAEMTNGIVAISDDVPYAEIDTNAPEALDDPLGVTVACEMALRATVQLDEATIIGHSGHGAVATHSAAANHEGVRRVISWSGLGFNRSLQEIAEDKGFPTSEFVGRYLLMGFASLGSIADPEARKNILGVNKTMWHDRHTLGRQMIGAAALNTQPAVIALTDHGIPTHVAYGATDRLFRPNDIEPNIEELKDVAGPLVTSQMVPGGHEPSSSRRGLQQLDLIIGRVPPFSVNGTHHR